MVVNINPGYVGAIAATGTETFCLLILAGPTIQGIIKLIEVEYVQNILIAANGYDYWLEQCRDIDPACNSTADMATLQWGYYSLVLPNQLGLDNTEMQ